MTASLIATDNNNNIDTEPRVDLDQFEAELRAALEHHVLVQAETRRRMVAAEPVDYDEVLQSELHYHLAMMTLLESRDDGELIIAYIAESLNFVRYMKSYNKKAFSAERIHETLKLAYAWKVTEYALAILGLRTLSLEQWTTAIPQEQDETSLAAPVWHLLLERRQGAFRWYADEWYNTHKDELEAPFCSGQTPTTGSATKD